uniref:SAP domain-containing protein n=1 Tax=Davidia involucrata TaxID=16924 RepID=A0A5B7A7C4_DAVIN
MENKEVGDFYCRLSKKELQDLCKKYGLSPYKTKSSLVNSLNSYFEKKNLSLLSLVGRSSIRSTSLMPQLQFGAHSSKTADPRKDNHGITTCLGEEDNRENNSPTVKCSGLRSCMEAKSYDKASEVEISEDLGCSIYNIREKKREISHSNKNNLAFVREVGMGNMDQIQHRNVNRGACPAENAFNSSMKSSTEVPSFEFYVRSEEGINLFVDLNSSPSDWSKILENEVCTCQTVHENKFRSFREELELLGNSNKQMKSFSLWNTGSGQEMDNGHVNIKSSPNPIMSENGHVEFDHPDGGDGTFRVTAIEPFTDAIETSARLEEEKERLPLSRLNSDVPDQMISGMEACLRDGEAKPLVPDVFDTPHTKIASNSDVSVTSEGPESLDMLAHRNSKLSNENCENLTVKNTCSLLNPNVVYPGYSAIGSVELQLSEVASQRKDASCSPCKNNCILDLVDTKQNVETGDGGLANSSEVNNDTCGNHMPTCAEELKRNNLINGTKTSECLHCNQLLEKRSENLVSDNGPKRKRQDSEYHNGCTQPEGKILRSSKRLAGEGLPRRSMRLVSK